MFTNSHNNTLSHLGSNICRATMAMRRRKMFQSTLPRGERRVCGVLCKRTIGVSIHAPTWGATAAKTTRTNGYQVSIHAPTWGATLFLSSRARTHKRFNPRSHVGSDHRVTHRAADTTGFNPRSHVGSDSACRRGLHTFACFNPRSHVGSDPYVAMTEDGRKVFQSTLPRGERRIISTSLFIERCFNPRSHVGSDLSWGPYRFYR